MHFVIFTGGESPAPDDAAPYFARRAPGFVIAADSGLLTLERYRERLGGDFAPSLILGDMDSLGDDALLRRYPADIVRRFGRDKDATDTELALGEARGRAGPGDWVTLVGAGGGRADHFLAVFDLFATGLAPDCWLCGGQALWHARSGRSFSVGALGPRDVMSVARTTASRTGGSLRSEGLRWEHDLFRAEGMPSVSNRAAPGRAEPVRISVRAGGFVLILPLSARVRVQDSPSVSRSTASEKDVSAAASASSSP